MNLGRFVRVDYAPLRALLERAMKHEDLRDLARIVSRSGVFDEECARLEQHNDMLYHNLLDE